MQLLGIYIRKERKGITKILQEDWYPFGNYKKPARRKVVKVTDAEQRNVAKSNYQREGLPEISVNTIVGMNGAGKSTLLDIYYRIINNFAFRMLGTKGVKSTGRELQYARGVHADLFFICEGMQYKIACRDLQTTLYKNEDGDSFSLVSIKNSDDPKTVLRNFFYTISTNYSIYAFNEKEYVPDGIVANIDSGINGDWLKVRISPKWYRRIGLLVPRGAEAWYRSYRSDGTGTKVPIYTLSKGAVRTVPQGTPR